MRRDIMATDACGLVRCVAVNQDIKVGIDVGEHSPYHVSPSSVAALNISSEPPAGVP
jgi:hypothetical protein